MLYVKFAIDNYKGGNEIKNLWHDPNLTLC